MAGEAAALGLAITSGLIPILIRRATLTSEPTLGVFITLVVASPLYLIGALVTGEASSLLTLNGVALGYFAAAGVLHFLIGRTLSWHGVRMIGAARATQLVRVQILLSPLLALVFLNQALSANDALAMVSVLGGAVLISLSAPRREGMQNEKSQTLPGILASATSGILWGISPILITLGYSAAQSPLIATFVASTAAAIGYTAYMVQSRAFANLFAIEKSVLRYVLAAAFLSPLSVLLRFTAIYEAEIVTYSVIAGLSPLFTLVLSYVFIRRLEFINLKVVLAAFLRIFGAYVVTL